MVNTHFRSDEIESAFQQIGNEQRFHGTQTVKTPQGRQLSVERTYEVDQDTRTLQVYTTYTVENHIVEEQMHQWDLSDDGQRVLHSGEDIEAFCKSNHNIDPQTDMEIALKNTN